MMAKLDNRISKRKEQNNEFDRNTRYVLSSTVLSPKKKKLFRSARENQQKTNFEVGN